MFTECKVKAIKAIVSIRLEKYDKSPRFCHYTASSNWQPAIRHGLAVKINEPHSGQGSEDAADDKMTICT